ncbi:MAG: flagellar hook-length control protein FliK [Brevundimonas sp.]|nr:flagellar hook-length control protein FliK [Brevundimonas sp.]
MSALTLLSVTAPAAPNASQGSSAEGASGFQNLLAALTGAGSAAREAATARTDTPVLDELQVETPPAAGFLVSPTAPPSPLVLTPLPVDSGSTAKTNEPQVQPHLTDDTAKTGEPQVQPRLPDVAAKTNEPQVQPRLTDVAVKTTEPQVQPRLAEIRAAAGTTGDIPATLAATAAANEAAQVIARTSASPAPSSPLPVAAPPAPLRPLAERTSRPLDTPTVRTGDGARAVDPAPVAAATATVASQPSGADQPARLADFIVAAAGRETAKGGEAGVTAPDLPPVEEGAVAQTQAASTARETAVSQLSRVAIEATAQIAAQILRRLEGRSTRFEMALTPDELGRVDVKLDIDSEGRLNARLAFDNPAAATDLRGRADELRRQLEEAGFHLADDALEFAERDSGSSAFDRGQDSRNGSSRAFADASRLNAEIDVDQPPRWLSLSLSPSGVDMKV